MTGGGGEQLKTLCQPKLTTGKGNTGKGEGDKNGGTERRMKNGMAEKRKFPKK